MVLNEIWEEYTWTDIWEPNNPILVQGLVPKGRMIPFLSSNPEVSMMISSKAPFVNFTKIYNIPILKKARSTFYIVASFLFCPLHLFKSKHFQAPRQIE